MAAMFPNEPSEPLEDCAEVPRLPELSAPVILKNVWYEIEKLKNASTWQLRTGHSSETLAKYPDFTVVLVLMKAATLMSKHRVSGRASISVIQGRIEVHLFGERTIHLAAGEILMMDKGITHDVQALEECAFLLTIAGIPESI
jgi:quercetin dioxygenase-like cupin family protein